MHWIQEENINGGAFYYVERRIARVMNNLEIKSDVKYVGRRAVATTAVGSVELHKNEASQLTQWISDLIL